MNIANQGFPATRADINNALQALASNNSGTSAPSTMFANQWWYDTTNNKLYIRNEANNAWIQVAVLDQTNNEWQITTGQISASDGDGLVFKTDDGNTRITLSDGGDVTFADGTDIITATAGTSNVRVGVNAGNSIASGGNYNTVVGDEAGTALTTGDRNTAVGFEALKTATTAQYNTAIGYQALELNTGNNNTAVGDQALEANTSGANNSALGDDALVANTTGANNVAIGASALAANTTAEHNVAVGYQAADANTTGVNLTVLGAGALGANTTGSSNTAIGRVAMLSNTTGTQNVGVGVSALEANSTGSNNTAMGNNSLGLNSTASNNTAVGFNAMVSNTTGDANVAVGKSTLQAHTTGRFNTGCGYEALYSNTTGGYNTALGQFAVGANTTGTYNVGFGNNALVGVTTGSYNVGSTRGGEAITTGEGNVCIGYQANTPANNTNYSIVMGYQPTGVGSENFTFGKGSTDSNIAFGATSITAPSDIRLKEDIQDATAGLGFIKDLRPVTFRWKQEKDVPSDMKAHVSDSTKRVMNEHYNHGFIAQEVKTVIDSHSDIKDGFDMWTEDEADGRQRIGDASLMPIMVKALQELSAKNDALEARIATLEG